MSEIRKKTDALIGLAPGAGDILLSMNLSTTSDIMRSSVSWCRIISSEEENLTTGQHKHIMHELQYVYEGELRIVTDHSIACHPDEYIFIPSGVEHRIADRASSTRKLVIGFEVSSPNEAIGSLFNKAQRPIVSKASPAFHALAEALLFKTSNINLTASVSVAYIIHTMLLEMVNSLATLFRISISKGHELITIAEELEHAESYLKIQKIRMMV